MLLYFHCTKIVVLYYFASFRSMFDQWSATLRVPTFYALEYLSYRIIINYYMIISARLIKTRRHETKIFSIKLIMVGNNYSQTRCMGPRDKLAGIYRRCIYTLCVECLRENIIKSGRSE